LRVFIIISKNNGLVIKDGFRTQSAYRLNQEITGPLPRIICMANNFTHNPRKIYHVVVIIWVIFFVTVMSGIVAVDLQRAEKKFAEHATMHLQQANDRVHINESILEGTDKLKLRIS